MNHNLCNNCGGEYEYRNGHYICRICGAYQPEETADTESENTVPDSITFSERDKISPQTRLLALVILCIRFTISFLGICNQEGILLFCMDESTHSSSFFVQDNHREIHFLSYADGMTMDVAFTADAIESTLTDAVFVKFVNRTHKIGSVKPPSFLAVTYINIPYYNTVDEINLKKSGKLVLPELQETDFDSDKIITESGRTILRYSKNQVTPS